MLLIDTEERTKTTEQAALRPDRAERRRQRLRDAGLAFGILAIVVSDPAGRAAFAARPARRRRRIRTARPPPRRARPPSAHAPTAAEAKGVKFERFERVDPALPAIPPGEVKRFEVDVYEHVTKVSDDLAPTEVWSYAINGVEHRGTGVSEPMVVEVGDRVKIDLVNGSSERMSVRMPHSIDYHSSEVNPGEAFQTIPPGGRHSFEFVAEHPGVFMYHCATDPVLHHTGAGMVGAMIVKPKDLAPVDRELWINQQEFYIGKPGGQADMQKMQAKQPDVIAFNGYAAQYKKEPIAVERGETIRMFVLNSGPSIWSAFHVIGTVFDKTSIEGVVGRHAQTVNLAPSQGGWVEFTLDAGGHLPLRHPRLRRHGQGLGRGVGDRDAPHVGMKH